MIEFALNDPMYKRRAFIKSLIRAGMVVSLAAFSGIMVRRSLVSPACLHNAVCGNCGSEKQCRLPEADQHRLRKARKDKTPAEEGYFGK